MIESAFESWFLLLFVAVKIIQLYIQFKQSFDALHVDQLIRICMLVITLIFVGIKYIDVFDKHSWSELFVFAFEITINILFISISMLISRIFALKILK